MKRKKLKKILSLALASALMMGMCGTAASATEMDTYDSGESALEESEEEAVVEEESEGTSGLTMGEIVEVEPYDNRTDTPTGRTYLVYEPYDIEPSGANSPIVMIAGDIEYTVETAEAAAIELGLEDFCQQNQCYAVFLGPNDVEAGWQESDLEYYDEAINLFGELLIFRDSGLFTRAQLISNQDIIYVIAEGGAADFIVDYTLKSDNVYHWADYDTPTFTFQFSHVAAGVVLYNPTSDGSAIDLGDDGIAAVVVNGNDSLVSALCEADNAVGSETLADGIAYYDPSATYKRVVSVTSSVTDGFDGSVLEEYEDTIISVKRDLSGDTFPLTQSLDWERLGIDEYILSLDTSDTNTVNYQVYIPQNLDTSGEGDVPLVIMFHGGGETADIAMASTEYPILGKEYGFITIAVDQHYSEGTTLDETNINQFMEQIFEDYPCIDQSRVYLSGMSMGAIKTWTLALNAPEYFAAIAPFNGVLRDDATGSAAYGDELDFDLGDMVMPTFYTAGRESTMPEMPNTDEDPNGYVARQLRCIFSINGVTDDYVFDESVDNVWGIEADRTESKTDSSGYYTMNFNYFADEAGHEYTVLVDIENMGHETHPFVAEEAWAFLSQFSRDENGNTIIDGEDDDDLKNGVCKVSDGVWAYYVDGVIQDGYYGFRENEYGIWYIEDGYVTFETNGVIQDTEGTIGTKGDWYYVKGSEVLTDYTGVANYKNDYGWWYIKNGKVDFTANTVASNKYGWWYVVGGKVQFDYTGVANYSNSSGWWYIKNGKVDFTANTVAKNNHGWWYVVGGKVQFNYTGVANYSNSSGWWYIKNGKVDFTYTGKASNKYGTWNVVNGKVKF